MFTVLGFLFISMSMHFVPVLCCQVHWLTPSLGVPVCMAASRAYFPLLWGRVYIPLPQFWAALPKLSLAVEFNSLFFFPPLVSCSILSFGILRSPVLFFPLKYTCVCLSLRSRYGRNWAPLWLFWATLVAFYLSHACVQLRGCPECWCPVPVFKFCCCCSFGHRSGTLHLNSFFLFVVLHDSMTGFFSLV